MQSGPHNKEKKACPRTHSIGGQHFGIQTCTDHYRQNPYRNIVSQNDNPVKPLSQCVFERTHR